jgi:hypothetical protein
MVTAALVAAVVFLGVGCAVGPKRISLPAEEAEFARNAGEGVVTKLAEHYATLHREQRPPTDAEFGYWTGRLESARLWFAYLMSKAREETGPDYLGILGELAKLVFSNLPAGATP